MKITCPSCSARYSIDDAKVKGKAFKFTCKKCGQTHVYRGTADGSAAAVSSGAPAAAPAPAAAAPPQGGEEDAVWYVAVGDEQQGPYTVQQICEYIQNDQLDPESYMWKEGMEDWLPVQQVQEFAAYYQGGGAPAEAPAPAPQQAGPFAGTPEDVTVASPFLPGSVPQQDAGDLFAFGGAGSPKQPAAQRSADPSPFGAFGAGGGAAAVAARGGADLFGGAQASPFEGGAPEEREEDVMMGAAAAAPSPRVDASKMIGQRNENSVLFSLSSLQALAGGRSAAAAGASGHAAPVVAAVPKAGFASGEGSGLIDIRAMAGSVAKQEEKHDDLFGFGSGGAIGAPVAVPILTRPIRHEEESRKPMYILIGVIGAFAVAIVVLLIVLFGRKEEKVVVQQVPVVAGGGDGGTTIVAASGAEADAGTPSEEPDAAAAKADEDKGGAGDAAPTGDAPPTDGDPNAKAADGGEGGEPPPGEGPRNPGGRHDAGRRIEGQDAGSGAGTPPARDAGSAAQRDTGRLAGDLSALITPRRDAGSGGSSDLPATPSRDDVRSKFESVRGAVKACTGNQAGTASVATTIQGSSGRVTRVNVTGDFTGPAATCISNAIRGLSFPQFSNPTLTVNYSYRF